MKNFFNVGWDDIDSAIDGLGNPQQFVNQISETTEEPIQKMMIKTFFSLLYGNAQKRRFQKDLTGIVIVDHEWDAQSPHPTQGIDLPSYIDNAQYLSNIFEELEPVRIFAGPSASSYMKIMVPFSPVQTSPLGIHLIGHLGNAEVFRVPNSVIPDNVIYLETDKNIIKYTLKGLRGSEE